MSNLVLSGGVSEMPQYKNQCIWKLSVTYENETIEVGYPLTIDFQIVRNTSASANTATFNIYNLNAGTRNDTRFFFQDRFATDKVKSIKFEAGYGNNLVTCFQGKILEAYTHRQGTEVITSIQALDYGIASDYVNTTIDAGTSFKEAYKLVLQTSKDLTIGAIGDIDGIFQTPTTFEGNIIKVLNNITGNNTFIDGGVANTLLPNECLNEGVTVIQASSGLLSTPQRRGGEVVIDTLFNPNYKVGQLLEIKSDISSAFSGTYKVCGITHSGVISGAVAGTRKTTLNLWIGAFLPNANYNVTQNTEIQPFVKVKQEEITPVNIQYGESVYEVYRYIRDNNGNVPTNKKITSNISWKEMLLPTGSGNTTQQIYSQINEKILNNCASMAKLLQDFIDTYIAGATINIISGYRTKENNQLAGGKAGSLHLEGLAIDLTINGMTAKTAYDKYFKKYWQYYTYYNPKGSIHVQARLGKGGAKR